MKTTQKTMALIVIGSAALMGGLVSSAMADPNVRTVVRSWSTGYSYSSTAGILVIDGVSFTIHSNRSIGRQIVDAFRECGYRASIDHGKVVIQYGHYAPKVRWYDRGYRASIYQDRGRMKVSWFKKYRTTRSVYRWNGIGHGDSYWYDRKPRHGYTHDYKHGYTHGRPHYKNKGYPHSKSKGYKHGRSYGHRGGRTHDGRKGGGGHGGRGHGGGRGH